MTETKKSLSFKSVFSNVKKSIFSYVNMGTIIVAGLLLAIFAMGAIIGIPFSLMLHDCITRFSRSAILVLAMVPAIKSGTGPNFALPLGIVCGLLAEIIAIYYNFFGLSWLLFAVVLAIITATIVGYGYGKLMNAVKGSEMIIAIFAGFAAVGLMNLVWLSKIFERNIWIGCLFPNIGIRTTIALDQVNAAYILDKFLAFKIAENIIIPTGTLLVVFLLCFLVYLFFRSKPGLAISASGDNPMFARATGVHVDNSRILASIISMALGAVGIIVYGQSFGYVQLYDGPFYMGFPAVAAVLIGGATLRRAKVFHVILGAFIFNSLLGISVPVNRLLAVIDASIFTDIIRQVVQNGIILYALVQMTRGK